MPTNVNTQLIAAVVSTAKKAGRRIFLLFTMRTTEALRKKKITHRSQRPIYRQTKLSPESLRHIEPNVPILSEESAYPSLHERKKWPYYWLVDPLDGTQEFINKNGQFTVNIALMKGQYPLWGVVYAPTQACCYWGGKNLPSFKQTQDTKPEPLHTRQVSTDKKTIVLGSRSFANANSDLFINRLKTHFNSIELKRVGSSLKGCLIAEGLADIYPRLGPTSEWDTAAVQAIVEGAGGGFFDVEGNRFRYNYKESLKNGDFIILGDQTVNWRKFWSARLINDIKNTTQKT